MTTNKNIDECGWFYHAPAKKSEVPNEPVETPYISQIPGLSDYTDEDNNEPKPLYFKDTDTKFIRLSKQGGRKDLLVFNDKKSQNKEAQGYPRVDWFYLQDNAREDAQNAEPKEPWKFLLPDYMVHKGYTPSCADENIEYRGTKSRVPYACDKLNVFETEGKSVTDKRVKIPEARHHGYGVRNNKPAPQRPQTEKPPSTQVKKDTNSVTKGDGVAEMHHILAYDYEKQWHQQMQRSNAKSPPQKLKGEQPIPSEYDDKYGKTVASMMKNTQRPSPSPTSRRSVNNKDTTTQEDKELFKLSKFKNVPAKIDSHQPTTKPVSVIN